MTDFENCSRNCFCFFLVVSCDKAQPMEAMRKSIPKEVQINKCKSEGGWDEICCEGKEHIKIMSWGDVKVRVKKKEID